MKGHNWNMCSIIISISIVLLTVEQCLGDTRPDRSKFSELRCYTCVGESCEGLDWKKQDPKNCTVDDLNDQNQGPVLLWNLTYIPYSPIHEALPEFICLKAEAYSYLNDVIKKVEVRRCALRLMDNGSCTSFYNNQDRFARTAYINASCFLCEEDGCNSGAFNYIWIPILFISIISCLLLK